MAKKIIRAATVGMSLNIFCKGLLRELVDDGYEVVALSSPDEDLEELLKKNNLTKEEFEKKLKDDLKKMNQNETENSSNNTDNKKKTDEGKEDL